MRVLQIVSNLSIRSGVMTVLMNYYRHIERSHIQFDFLYFDEREDTYEEEIRHLGGAIYKFSRKTYPMEWKRFCRANYGKYEIVHNHELYLACLFLNMKKRLGNEIYISHAHATKFSDVAVKELRNKILALPSSAISDYLLACSCNAGEALFGKAFQKKGYILKNAIEIEKFRFDESLRAQIRKELQINQDTMVIGHVGNFTPPKNHSKIIDIFQCLLERQSNAKLLLVGEGELRAEIAQRVKDIGIAEKIIFTGVTSNVVQYLNAMDVFLFPSLFEGLGIALVEAQANGLSCVYSNAVPKEADVCGGRNKRLDVWDADTDWVDALLEVDKKRYMSQDKVRCAGYAIKEEAKNLQKFYETILEGGKVNSLEKVK